MKKKQKTIIKVEYIKLCVVTSDCDAIYIGRTLKSFKIRLKEHERSTSNNKKCTGFAEQCINNNQNFNKNNFKILHYLGVLQKS